MRRRRADDGHAPAELARPGRASKDDDALSISSPLSDRAFGADEGLEYETLQSHALAQLTAGLRGGGARVGRDDDDEDTSSVTLSLPESFDNATPVTTPVVVRGARSRAHDARPFAEAGGGGGGGGPGRRASRRSRPTRGARRRARPSSASTASTCRGLSATRPSPRLRAPAPSATPRARSSRRRRTRSRT